MTQEGERRLRAVVGYMGGSRPFDDLVSGPLVQIVEPVEEWF